MISEKVIISPGLKVGVQWIATGPLGLKLFCGLGTNHSLYKKSAVASFFPAQWDSIRDRSNSSSFMAHLIIFKFEAHLLAFKIHRIAWASDTK